MNRSQLVAASHANEVLLCVPCLSSKTGPAHSSTFLFVPVQVWIKRVHFIEEVFY